MAGKKKPEAKVIESFNLPTEDNTPDSYVPEGYGSADAYLKDLREDYNLDVEADRENREEALDDKNFAAGNTWDPEVLEHRKGLPCLKIHTVPQFTAQLVGDWQTNRNSVKVLPAEDGDTDVADIRADLVRAIEVKSRASRVYDSAFESTVQCGDGAFRISVEYARDDVFDQDIFIRPIEDCLSVVWDRMSVDPTGRDATRCFVDDLLPRRQYEARWGEIDPSTLSAETMRHLHTDGWLETDLVRVTEHWRLIERNRLLGLFEDGWVGVIEGDKLDELVATHGEVLRTRMAPCTYAQMHLVTGWKILAGPYEYKLNRLPIIRMTGRVVNVGGKRVRYGLVRFMKDPVRLRNFWRSTAAEQLGYAPKAQWLATESAVEGREDDFRKAHLSRDPLLIANDEAEFGKTIMRVEPPAIQAALLNEAQINVQDMKDVTGIHDASLGIKSNETSGRAIHARQREGDIANLTYHDNGNAAILEAGDIINQLIPQIYDGTRVVRIIGEDQTPKFVKLNDPYDPSSINIGTGSYDVVMSTGTSYQTRRVEAAAAMMEAVQVYPEMMQIAGDLVAKAQDWPGAQELAERLKKTIPPQFLDEEDQEGASQAQGIPPEVAAQAMQRLAELEAENGELKAQHDLKAQEIEIKRYEAETKRMEVESKTAVADIDLDMRLLENAQQAERDELDRHEREQDRTTQTELEHKKIDKASEKKPDSKAKPKA